MRYGVGLVGFVVGIAGCGELAVDGSYRGEPLLEITGTVTLDTGAAVGGATGELRAALFWARPTAAGAASGGVDVVTAVEQDVGRASRFPARYTLTVFVPPSAALIGQATDVQGELAAARILVYLDVDGDGTWDRGEEDLVGAAAGAVVVYAPDGLAGGRYGALTPGFHVLWSDAAPGVCDAASVPGQETEVPIVVDMRYPAVALGDLDCDGGAVEWSGTCPSPATILASCRDQAAASAFCTTCEPLLWDAGSTDDLCDAWRDECDRYTNHDECEEALEHCRDEVDEHDDCVDGSTDCEDPDDDEP